MTQEDPDLRLGLEPRESYTQLISGIGVGSVLDWCESVRVTARQGVWDPDPRTRTDRRPRVCAACCTFLEFDGWECGRGRVVSVGWLVAPVRKQGRK
jgi:hypothetical protein